MKFTHDLNEEERQLAYHTLDMIHDLMTLSNTHIKSYFDILAASMVLDFAGKAIIGASIFYLAHSIKGQSK